MFRPVCLVPEDKMNQTVYNEYLAMLNEELVPALGCTEPIAIALASAKARETLGGFPESIEVACSGNIVKNAKGVIVPTTGNMKGIDTSAILGALGGDSSKGLEVLTSITPADIERAKELLKTGLCRVTLLDTPSRLHIWVCMKRGNDTAVTEIRESHTNFVLVERNGTVLLKKEAGVDDGQSKTDRSLLNLLDIYTFACEVAITDIKPLFDRQIEYNLRIAKEGLQNPYGAQIGSTLLKHYGGDIRVYARALAAAGSDARMGGSVLPVIINSGSGNQGMTVSLPVYAYAVHLKSGEEKLYRALALSNLTAFLQKRAIGRLSAYCGAVCAACGSGAGITYLHGGDYEAIARTVTNTLANVSGIVCDGAKSSCAAKIAASVDAAILGHEMSMDGKTFGAGEGLVMENVEETIASIGRMASEGMKETDTEILRLMTGGA